MVKNTLKGIIFVLAVAFLSACSSAGTGLSENERYLSYLQNSESAASIVLTGHHYGLPEPFANFIANGWAPTAESLHGQFIEDFSSLYLQPLTHIVLDLENDSTDIEMYAWIANHNAYEQVSIFDASVITISIRDAKKDQIVVAGGITGGTSRRDVLAAIETLDVLSSIQNNTIIIIQEGSSQITLNRGVARDFRISSYSASSIETSWHTVSEEDVARIQQERMEAAREEREERRDEVWEASRQERMANARYHEGIVIGIYYERGILTNAYRWDGIVVIQDEHGTFVAINTHFMPNYYDVEDLGIQPGDTLQVWSDGDSIIDSIIYEGHGRIDYVLPGVILINGEREYSLWIR